MTRRRKNYELILIITDLLTKAILNDRINFMVPTGSRLNLAQFQVSIYLSNA